MTILQNLITSKSLPILFIGSGMSKRYLCQYPNWNELLQEGFNYADPSGITFIQAKEKLQRDLISDFELYQRLGTEAEDVYNKAFYENYKTKGETLPDWATESISPFKKYICDRFLKREFIEKKHLIRERNMLEELSTKILAIMTTNYDTFLEEDIFTNFDVVVNQSELFKSDRTNICEIYKIHGCAKDVNSIILTENDYNNFDKNRKLIVAKMLTLFADSPIIFMGYSMTDENIRKIIIDFLDCLDAAQRQNIASHFVFVEWIQNEKELVESQERIVTNYGDIPITKISTDNYSRLFKILNNITPGIPTSIVKQSKRIIKSIVDYSMKSGDPSSMIFTSENIDEIPEDKIAVAFGYRETILGLYGYKKINIIDLFEDILYDNKNFDKNLIATEMIKSISKTTLIPIFKYISVLSEEEISENTNIQKFICRNSYETIYSGNIIKDLINVPECTTIKDLKEELQKNGIDDNTQKSFKYLAKSIKNFSHKDIRDFCKFYFHNNRKDCESSTHFKRAVMYLDLIENKKE